MDKKVVSELFRRMDNLESEIKQINSRMYWLVFVASFGVMFYIYINADQVW